MRCRIGATLTFIANCQCDIMHCSGNSLVSMMSTNNSRSISRRRGPSHDYYHKLKALAGMSYTRAPLSRRRARHKWHFYWQLCVERSWLAAAAALIGRQPLADIISNTNSTQKILKISSDRAIRRLYQVCGDRSTTVDTRHRAVPC